jgi:fatty acid amide hydrolase
MSLEINRLCGFELTELLKSGQLSVREVVEAHIKRTEEINPRLNALVVPLFEQARKDAEKLDYDRLHQRDGGSLYGVPFTVKESIEVAGTPSTLGLTERISHSALTDAFQVMRLRQAGAVLLGKTNVSLLLKAYETDNPVYGRTNNPWSLDRAPGGSTGGEAALVAAGGSVLGLGSDLGGSIRLPAHACGVYGFRPTAGKLTMLGHARVNQSGLGAISSQPGLIARCVKDLKLALSILAAPGQDNIDTAVPPVPLRDPSMTERLRVAFYDDNGLMSPSPAIRRAVHEAAVALHASGVEVEQWQPPDIQEAWEIQLRLTCADGLAGYRHALRKSKGIKARLTAMPGIVRSAMVLLARLAGQERLSLSMALKKPLSLEQYSKLLGRRRLYQESFLSAFNEKRFDAILSPPDALPALRHGSSMYVSGYGISYAGIYSLLGMPVGVVPATRVRAGEESDRRVDSDIIEKAARRIETGSAGLPVGVQVASRHWREDIGLAIMAMLEEHFRQQLDYPACPSV